MARREWGDLQQSPALLPLRQQLIMLASIAGYTGYDDVPRVICPSTAQRNNVVNLIVFAKFHRAIVALATLTLVLLLCILGCILTWRSRFSGSAFSRFYTIVFRMFLIVPAAIHSMHFSMGNCMGIVSFSDLLTMLLYVQLIACQDGLFVRLIVAMPALTCTSSTSCLKTGFEPLVRRKVVQGSREKCQALRALLLLGYLLHTQFVACQDGLFVRLIMAVPHLSCASSTSCHQTRFERLIGWEIVQGSREKCQALAALLLLGNRGYLLHIQFVACQDGLFVCLTIALLLLVCASSTSCHQAGFDLLVGRKVVQSGREKGQAPGALLLLGNRGYNSIHSRSLLLLLSRPWMLVTSQGQHTIFPIISQCPFCMQIHARKY